MVLQNVKVKVKQVQGAECKVVFWLSFWFIFDIKKVQQERTTTWEKCNMEKEKHGNNRGANKIPRTSKMESFAAIFNGFVNCLVCQAADYSSANSVRCTKCSRKKLQHPKRATGEECKTKTLQRMKVPHKIEQYIKRVQHKKKCNTKRLLHKNSTQKKV